ncbi:MAG: PmoA family protein [Opitutaceae bacterium]|nr:PmoA family protein [Opitutaceae bacterium]
MLRLTAALCATVLAASARDYRLTLAPATADRAGQVIAFQLPADAPRPAQLRDAAGRAVALQTDADRTARFVVPWQKAGESLAFTLSAANPKAPLDPPAVVAAPDGGHLRVSVGGAPALVFRLKRDDLPREGITPHIVRAGYVHPVFSPSGKIVTDDYPSNHPHHHGIWAPWTKVSFQGRATDFWNMQDKKGAEDLVALDRSWSGPVHGGFTARLQSTDLTAPTPVKALDTTWLLTAYDLPGAAPAARMFELTVTHACATAKPVVLPEYHYGGFGLRGAAGWNGPGPAARFLTSEGETDRIKGNNTRVRWCYLGGAAGDSGGLAGTAVLGHPGNFRAPQPVRLHPNMPYFSLVPQQLGAMRIEPGQPYVTRYRFVVTDGAPDRARLDAYWQGYAHPAAAKIEAR